MSAPAAFKATYSDLKFIKSRKVAQVMLELPIEQADAFVKAFGTPNPASETWVAIARLDLSKTQEPEKAKRKFDELPLSQQAALLCNREAFWRFLDSHYQNIHVADEQSAAAVLRDMCGVLSRSEIDSSHGAAERFKSLSSEFDAWLSEPVF